jgi:hypothetical protein
MARGREESETGSETAIDIGIEISYCSSIGMMRKNGSSPWQKPHGELLRVVVRSELRNVLKGIRISISQQRLDEVVPRVGAALGAYFVLNLVGALFAIAAQRFGIGGHHNGLGLADLGNGIARACVTAINRS